MLSAFTLFHVVLSLVGIASGFVVLYGLRTGNGFEGWTKIFLSTTILTSVTGFLFPFHGVTPGHILGVLSVIVLGIAVLARYRLRMEGGWRRTFVLTAIAAQYFNFFVLIAQAFQKVPALNAIAPKQSDPGFQIAQLVTLALFVALAIRAAMKFQSKPLVMARGA